MVNEEEIKRDALVCQLYDCVVRVKTIALKVKSLSLDSDPDSSLKFAITNLISAIRKIETF